MCVSFTYYLMNIDVFLAEISHIPVARVIQYMVIYFTVIVVRNIIRICFHQWSK
jgi:hypothetical protein